MGSGIWHGDEKHWNSHIRAKNPIDVTPAKPVPEVSGPGAGVQWLSH